MKTHDSVQYTAAKGEMNASTFTFTRHSSGNRRIANTLLSSDGPGVKIVLPERFPVLSDQLFDLRVEVTGLSSLDAQIQLVVSGNKHDGLQGIGVPEVTTNNDNNPASLDKAWTWRRVSFDREGLRTLKAVITDGANTYEASTQTGVQEFKLQGNKNIILFIGDAMGTAYRDAGRILAQSTRHLFREGFLANYNRWTKCLLREW